MQVDLFRPVARIEFGGCRTPNFSPKVDLLNPKSGLFEPHPHQPSYKNPIFGPLCGQKWTFCQIFFWGCIAPPAPPWLRAWICYRIKVDLAGIVIHKCTHIWNILFLRFRLLYPVPSTTVQPPRARPVKTSTGICLRAPATSS